MTKQKLALIGAQLGWGAQVHETQWGPKVLLEHHLEENILQPNINIYWHTVLQSGHVYQDQNTQLNYQQRLADIISFNQKLAEITSDVILNQELPIVIGGDHAIAMGTWSGVVNALNAYDDFGLIWIDAHLDAHTPASSPSGAFHGMPVAHLLGYGEKSLKTLLNEKPKINKENIIFIGIRSFEEEEYNFISEQGIKVFDMKAVESKGFAQVMQEAIKTLESRVSYLGLTIDLDAFDPSDAPGVGSPEDNGLRSHEVLPGLAGFGYHKKLRAIEIAEYNPVLDVNGKTEILIQSLLNALFKQD